MSLLSPTPNALNPDPIGEAIGEVLAARPRKLNLSADDLLKIETMTRRGETLAAISQEFGRGITWASNLYKKNADFKAAVDRGRGNAQNGNGAVPKLTPAVQEIYDELNERSPITVDALIELTGQTRADVSSALRQLDKNNLTRQEGDSFFKLTNHSIPKAKANAPGHRKTPKANGAGAPQPTARVSPNGLTAKALESARVELLYQRVHGEPSPKSGEVIENLETELETLVRAAAAGA